MKKAVAALFFCMAFVPLGFAQELPPNTSLDVSLNAPMDSGKVHEGDMVQATVTDDVKYQGLVFIPKGQAVFLEIQRAEAGRIGGIPGTLFIQPRYTSDVNGEKVMLDGRQSDIGKMDFSFKTVVLDAVIPFYAFHKGKSIVYPAGKSFRVHTGQAITLKNASKAE